MMRNIAVIDTETTWSDKVMSIGVVIADAITYQQIDSKYYIIAPEYRSGGMYSNVLQIQGTPKEIIVSREVAMENILKLFANNDVDAILAYNANFDRKHLPELSDYVWFDIMKLAAYKQYNCFIDETMECCKTGRLKRDYGVESIYRLLSNDDSYHEKHNGWYDAIDELKIIEMLMHPIEVYENAKIK